MLVTRGWGRGAGSCHLRGIVFQFRKTVLEVGGGEGHQQYVKMVEMANFMLWIFYYDKKELG